MIDTIPSGEHLVKDTFTVAEYYPEHETRTESDVFERTKAEGDNEKLPCFVCGAENPEYHHVMTEWADTNAVDWPEVKAIATGAQSTVNGHPVKESLIYWLTVIAAQRGFDWAAFDPADPSSFVDSMAQMLPLCEKHHRAPDHGIHMVPVPMWLPQAFPLIKGFVETPA